MSRYYTRSRDRLGGVIWVRKTRPRPRSAAWEQARARRSRARMGAEEQARDSQGFILKEVGGHTVMRDPGPIDRYIWTGAHQKE